MDWSETLTVGVSPSGIVLPGVLLPVTGTDVAIAVSTTGTADCTAGTADFMAGTAVETAGGTCTPEGEQAANKSAIAVRIVITS
jgi:hypothetical protein